MAVLANSVEIDRTPEEVFDYLVDMRNELQWNPDVQSVEKITDGPVGLGTKYRSKWKQSSLIEVECTRYERPRSWQWVNGGPVTVTIDVAVTPTGRGSRLDTRFDAHPNGWFKLIFPVFLILIGRAERKNMTHIKHALESEK